MPVLMEVVKRIGKTPKEVRRDFFEIMYNLNYEENMHLTIEEVIEEVHKSKGIVVSAHPKQYDIESIKEVISLGVDGIEAYYPTHTKEDIFELKSLAKENNLIVTAGSDFHSPTDTRRHGNIGCVSLESEELSAFLDRLRSV